MVKADADAPETGFTCINLDYYTGQFNYCCLDSLPEGMMGRCREQEESLLLPGDTYDQNIIGQFARSAVHLLSAEACHIV